MIKLFWSKKNGKSMGEMTFRHIDMVAHMIMSFSGDVIWEIKGGNYSNKIEG